MWTVFGKCSLGRAVMCDGHGEEICAWLACVLVLILRRLLCARLAKN